MFDDETIPTTFVRYAADVLADTNAGLSGNDIVRETASHVVEYVVALPHPAYAFGAANKPKALYDSLMAFNGPQQHRIIKELAATVRSGTTRACSARNSRSGWRHATRNSRAAPPRRTSTRR